MSSLSIPASSARSSTQAKDEPGNAGNAGNAKGVCVTSTPSTSTRGMSVDPNQPSASGDTLSRLRKRKISSVTEVANRVGFDKTENDKVPAQRQNICGVLTVETDDGMADDVQLSRASLAKNPRFMQSKEKRTLIHNAIQYGNTESFSALLENNDTLLNVEDETGLTPLHYAIRWGTREQLIALLDRGADVNIQDEEGLTPLHYTCKWNTTEQMMTALLVREHVSINIKDNYGATPSNYVNQYGSPNQRIAFSYLGGSRH